MNTDKAEERTTKYTKDTKMKINHASPGGANEDNKEGRSFSDSFVSFVIFCSKHHPCLWCFSWFIIRLRVLRVSVVQPLPCIRCIPWFTGILVLCVPLRKPLLPLRSNPLFMKPDPLVLPVFSPTAP